MVLHFGKGNTKCNHKVRNVDNNNNNNNNFIISIARNRKRKEIWAWLPLPVIESLRFGDEDEDEAICFRHNEIFKLSSSTRPGRRS